MTRTGSLTVTLLLAAALVLPLQACAKKPPMNPDLQPYSPAGISQSSTGGEARLTLFSTLHLRLQYLDTATRARYFRDVAGQAADPFLPLVPGQSESFLVFLFTIHNQGESPVLISPSFASLIDPRGRVSLSPFDVRELNGIMAANRAFTPAVSRRFHDATVNVNPGQRLARLLVFPAMDRKPEMVEVIFPSVMHDNLTADAHFPFSVTWIPISSF